MKESPNYDEDPEPKKLSKAIQVARSLANFCLANWLIFSFGFATLMAYLFPHVAAKGGIIRSEYSILYGAVALIFLINAVQLSPDKLRERVTNWRLHIVVQGINLVLIPVIQLIRVVIAAEGVSSGAIEASILIGMIVATCTPTTIASGVVMTRNSGGDEAAAIIEVVLGNVTGAILTPWLIYGYLPRDPEFDSLKPAPPTDIGPMSTFSGAFETGAIYSLPNSSIIFNVLMNVAEYVLFTVICYYIAYPPNLLIRVLNPLIADSKAGLRLPATLKRAITIGRMDPVQVVAVCFCGAAKTTTLGIPLVASMWSRLDDFTISSIQVPVLLYTVEQVFLAQFFTIFFKHWLEKVTKSAADTDLQSPDERQSTV
ncbi:hypothetical protein DL769_007622 [Monosporascus sp. CRB-8-3]|nr:hypothetical protein DL769_007622 [Monosporascus sp. CRB-8-3]